jgi:acyl-CoA oxidase
MLRRATTRLGRRATTAARMQFATSSQLEWASNWSADVSTITLPSECTPSLSFDQSAAKMRELLKSEQLLLTDLRDDPEKFFLAHRLLAEVTPQLGPGFWIRFTVQYNLFAGTILAVAGPDQISKLQEIQTAGHLGCFALTEKLAGVNSGLVVHTTAEWDADAQVYRLNTPNEGAHKNWISQVPHGRLPSPTCVFNCRMINRPLAARVRTTAD